MEVSRALIYRGSARKAVKRNQTKQTHDDRTAVSTRRASLFSFSPVSPSPSPSASFFSLSFRPTPPPLGVSYSFYGVMGPAHDRSPNQRWTRPRTRSPFVHDCPRSGVFNSVYTMRRRNTRILFASFTDRSIQRVTTFSWISINKRATWNEGAWSFLDLQRNPRRLRVQSTSRRIHDAHCQSCYFLWVGLRISPEKHSLTQNCATAGPKLSCRSGLPLSPPPPPLPTPTPASPSLSSPLRGTFSLDIVQTDRTNGCEPTPNCVGIYTYVRSSLQRRLTRVVSGLLFKRGARGNLFRSC